MLTFISQLFLELLVLALLVSKIAQYFSNTIKYYMQFLDSREIEWHLFCKLLLQLTVLSMPKGCNSPVSTFEPALFWMITFFCGQTLYIFLQITFCSFYKSSLLSDKKKDWSYCKYSNCYLKFQSGTNQLSILQEIFYFIFIFKV